MRHPLLVKLIAVGASVLLIGMVLARVGWLVDERQGYQQEAVASVQQSYAGSQRLLGPVLQRRCSESWDVVTGTGPDRRTETQQRHFALQAVPEALHAGARTQADARYRGLFKVNGYAAHVDLRASWPTLAALQPQAEHAGGRLACEVPTAWVAVADVRGLRGARVLLDGRALDVEPGTGHEFWPQGLSAALPAAALDGPLTLTLALDFVGTAELGLVPAARNVDWSLASDWPHPSFGGRFLPAERQVRDDGFTARWAVSALASSAPQQVSQAKERFDWSTLDTLAVSFADPVNPYVLADRAVKYGLLFVALTFGAVGLAETLAPTRRVHPVQYALVGLALALFFLLLLALSEHLPFAVAYGGAAAACVLLLGHYARHMLGSATAGHRFGAGMALLYALLYLLLSREQTALLIGSVGLFAALAAVMLATRRIDWYRLAPHAPA